MLNAENLAELLNELPENQKKFPIVINPDDFEDEIEFQVTGLKVDLDEQKIYLQLTEVDFDESFDDEFFESLLDEDDEEE